MGTPETRRLTASVLVLCFLIFKSFADAPTNAQVDRLFAPWAHDDSPGAALVIVHEGSVVYQRGYGCANLEHRIPITLQTVFDVASVAKQFTGLAVAMLIENGKISPDEEIRKYLPEVPDFGSPITINHLLHHTSGLRDWPETLGLAQLDMGGVITLDTILAMVCQQRELDFPPGREHLYSNTGYNLLAAAVARISEQSFRSWTDENLFQPLGMKQTIICDDPGRLIPNRAESYAPAGPRKFQHVVSQLAAQGSSSLFTTIEDMGKWLLNFETARIGGKSAIERMHRPGKLDNGTEISYGFGVGLGSYHGTKMISHTGGWAGYRSVVMRIPDKRFAVAILANAANMDCYGLATKVADIYLATPSSVKTDESPPKPLPDLKIDRSKWADYLGTYRLGPGWLVQITREGDQLMAQATRESRFRMTPLSDTRFFVQAYAAAVEFACEDSGPVKHLLYRGIRAPKLISPDCTPARLASYVGDYWSDELRVVYHLEIQDGKLGTQIRTETWVSLMPTGEDSFDTDVGGMSVAFTRNATAEVKEFRVSGGRVRNIRFTRVGLR